MSSFFTWDASKYDIGVENMNKEHQQLIAIMNKLYEQNEKGANKEVLKKTLDELGAFTVKHFADEEKFQESIKFPDLATHKRIHQNLLSDFGKHMKAFETSGGKISSEFFHFLKLWLSSHIQHIDMNYGNFAKKTAA